MKHLKLFVSALLVVLFFASCDGNKGKVKDLSKQFVALFNENDKAGIYDMYEAVRKYDYLQFANNLEEDGISVKKNKETGLYEATINEERGQRLIFQADSLGEVKLVDSYGVMTPEELIKEMVDDPAEYTDLMVFVQNISGFKTLQEQVDEAKN